MFDEAKIKQAVASIIEAIGEDPAREGLRGTPERVAEMYAELFVGLVKDPKEELKVDFELGHREMGLYNTPWYWRIEREWDDLIKPIDEMTRQLKLRLDAIPTAAQRAAADQPITERFNKLGLKQ